MGIYLTPTQEIVDIHHSTALYHFISGGQKQNKTNKQTKNIISQQHVQVVDVTPGYGFYTRMTVLRLPPSAQIRRKDRLQEQGAQTVSIQRVQECYQELHRYRAGTPGEQVLSSVTREPLSPE